MTFERKIEIKCIVLFAILFVLGFAWLLAEFELRPVISESIPTTLGIQLEDTQ